MTSKFRSELGEFCRGLILLQRFSYHDGSTSSMDSHVICDPKLDDVLAFNRTLLFLERAGIPIGVGGPETNLSLRNRIEAINSKIAMAVARSSSIQQILESDDVLPSEYRSSLSTWLLCGNSEAALAALSDKAGEHRDMEGVLKFSLLQPLIVASLVYFGFLYLLFGVCPKLESIATQIGIEPGIGLRFLMTVRSLAWIWGVAGPLLIAFAVIFWVRNRSQWSLNCIPGRRRIADAIRNANFADGIRSLLQNDYSREQAVRFTGSCEPETSNKLERSDSTIGVEYKLPFLLKWALGEGLSRENKISALKASKQIFQGNARSRTQQLRAWFPAVVGASLGGLIVLFFGLSLFAPMIELLSALTRP